MAPDVGKRARGRISNGSKESASRGTVGCALSCAEPTGLLRVNAALAFGILHLAPLRGRFAKLYPKVSLHVHLNDLLVDLVEQGYDLAL